MSEDQDYYSLRLAKVNQSNPVVTTRDIRNSQGAQLVPKGEKLTHNKAELIVKHKLSAPLELSVNVSKCLDDKGLFEYLKKFIKTSPGLEAAIDDQATKKLIYLCKRYAKYPLIQQKLTVLADQLPKIYYRSLFSAVAGALIAIEMKLSDKDLEAVFIGGLMHNAGYLHLDPELDIGDIEEEKEDNPAIRVHPQIAKLFLDIVPGMPKIVGKAVEDHHERTDGTGFPKRKFGAELCLNSQIIAITDLIISGHYRCEKYGIHSHQLILLILQLNDNVHFEPVYKAAAKLIHKGPMPNTPPKNPPKAQAVLKQKKHILKLYDAEKKLALVLMKNTRTVLTRSIAAMVGRLASSLSGSGMMQDEYEDWLNELAKTNSKEEHLSLLKSYVMQTEIEAQLVRLTNIMNRAITTIPDENTELIESSKLSFDQIIGLCPLPKNQNTEKTAQNQKSKA